jgi:hypothetical protein
MGLGSMLDIGKLGDTLSHKVESSALLQRAVVALERMATAQERQATAMEDDKPWLAEVRNATIRVPKGSLEHRLSESEAKPGRYV